MANEPLIDARAALSTVVFKLYAHNISAGDWATVSPADAKPKGLASYDTTDWLITLDKSSAIMKQHHQMARISPAEAETVRTGKLEDSVALLVRKASAKALAPQASPFPALPVAIGAAALLMSAGAFAYYVRRKRRFGK